MPPQQMIIATRKSPLAMIQARAALAWLQPHYPDSELRIEPFSTTGDERLQWSLAEKGGKGLFTSELEAALSEQRADIAVHSAKDLPTDLPAGLALAGFLPREAPWDVLIRRRDCARPRLIASGSPRRRNQLQRFFPDATWRELRGNVQTRLEKVAAGEADATVLALAGLKRLGLRGWPGLVFLPLAVGQCVPAAGQGAIALQCRAADAAALAPLLCRETGLAVAVERTCLALLGGGCHSAAAVHYGNGMIHIYEESMGWHSRPLRPRPQRLVEQITALLAEVRP
jgi:hydroxymethylbilane synthase